MLTKEQIFETAKPKIHRVDVPEWGGYVFIREMKGLDLVQVAEADTLTVGAARDVALSVVNENGQRLFTDDDAPKIAQLGASGIMRLHRAIMALNGLTSTEKNS